MQMAMAIVTVGELDTLLWLHTEVDPPQDEFAGAVAQVGVLKRNKGDLSRLRSLVLTDGGAPNAAQRAQLMLEVFEGNVKSAVVTTVLNNRLKRGIATAISWINPSFRAYSPEQFEVALSYLDLAVHKAALLAGFQELQKKLPKNKTLELATGQGA